MYRESVPVPVPPLPQVEPDDSSLPIEAYDSLAASSIVTLLDGLRPAQLRAVDVYERANRARRTVLTRIGQLLA